MNRSIRPSEAALLVVLAPVALSVVIAVIHHGTHGNCGPYSHCANNLSQLYKMLTVYSTMNGGRWPSARSDEFWRTLAKTNPPLIDESMSDVFLCPVKGDGVLGEVDYRGPSSEPATYRPADPIAADKEGNHGKGAGGYVLRQDGSVLACEQDDAIWKGCSRKLAP